MAPMGWSELDGPCAEAGRNSTWSTMAGHPVGWPGWWPRSDTTRSLAGRRRRRLGRFAKVAVFVMSACPWPSYCRLPRTPGWSCVSVWIATLGLLLLPRRGQRPAGSG